ncbi:MAG: hypothetical protein GY906_24000 [bacterium]|nr:hypothetical protein [bacterium]
MPEKRKSWTAGMVNKKGYWGGLSPEVLRKKRAFEAYKKAHPKGTVKPDSAGAKQKPKLKPKTPAQIRAAKAASLRRSLTPGFLVDLEKHLGGK